MLDVRNVSKYFGGVYALNGASLTIEAGELHALIGPNAAGKTTLIHTLAGSLRPDQGSVHFAGSDVTLRSMHQRAVLGLARSHQITNIFSGFTVLDNLALAARRASHLSHGEQRCLEVALALATKPTLLLLDEPMVDIGKTTTVRSICGLTRPRSGAIRFAGERIDARPADRIGRSGITLVPEGRQIFPNLSVHENLVAFAANRHAAREPWALDRVYAFFPRLAERAGNLSGRLSGGEQQMLAIGRALMTNPRLLILDEATEGLAPLVREEIWRCLAVLRGSGQTILVIDKYVERLIALADRHTILERGQVAWQVSSSELAADHGIWQRYLGI